MRKNFDQWQYKKYEAVIQNYSKDGLSSSKIAKRLRKRYNLDINNNYFARLIRRYLQWEREKVENDIRPNHQAKILIYDIETAPLMGYFWRLWQQNINPLNGMLQKSEWPMICWVAKWLFDDKYITEVMTPEEAVAGDDSRLIKVLWDLFDQADILIGHNIIKFDNRQANTRFIKHDLLPPSSFQSIDTYRHAKKNFDMPSYKLDSIAQFFGVGAKIETKFSLWEGCMKGDKKSLKDMLKYCVGDVKVQEEVYLKMRPYIRPHPNLGLYISDNIEVCPACASQNLGVVSSYSTYANTYDELRCFDCGHPSRSRKASIKKEDKRHLKISIPR